MKPCSGKKIFKIGAVFLLCFLFIRYGASPGLEARQKRWNAVTHDKTNFPLIGKHRSVPCSECHLKGVFQGTPTDCEACHWYRRQDDRYRLRLGVHCGACHTPFDWEKIKPGSWDHEQETGFRLEGIHKTLDCYQCHPGSTFPGRGSDCIDCHREDYNKADEPDHAALQFPTDCRICHNMLDWAGGGYYHLTFPLNGMHKTADCVGCHQNGRYSGTPTDCASCHLAQYMNTTSPNHAAAGYPTDCEICHGSSALDWQGAKVDHDRFWPLKGAHWGLDCIRCHARGYNISNDCINCHLDDYNNTTEPDHRKVGFHTDCEVCHLSEALTWSQVSFDHQFPIFSGKHQHLSCTECHRTANYIEFSCIDCHEHGKNEMDNKHRDVSGYSYNSQACYACHPTGES
jgi:hypothetical protein